MNFQNLVFILFLCLGLGSCKNEGSIKEANIISELRLDHFNIWVKNTDKAKEKLTALGFISVPDSLSTVHHGQGTSGTYFYFLNTYLELIFIYDHREFDKNNEENSDLDFAERSNFEKNGASPFGIALSIEDYDIEKIPFKRIRYHQDWMEPNSSIYAAANSKKNLNEPSVFVVYPDIQWQPFESVADLSRIPEDYAYWREFYKQPNGAEKVSHIVITTTDVDFQTETIKTLNGLENVTIKNGIEPLMEVYIDNQKQGKSYDLRPDLPLILYL